MKRFQLITICFTIFCAFFLISSSGGRAFSAGEGNTGAPGDNESNNRVCSFCHTTGNFGPSVAIKVMDPNDMLEISEYIPGATYKVEVSISTQIAPSAYGFQMVSLIDSDETDVGGWIDESESSNARISPAAQRTYVEHRSPSPTGTFSVDWQAPEEGSGNVTFYAAGNAVNLSGGTFGDEATTNSLTIQEGMTSSIFNSELNIQNIKLFPNPSSDRIYIETKEEVNGSYVILNLLGQNIHQGQLINGKVEVDLSTFNTGTYLINVFGEEKQHISSQKLIKI